MRCHDCLVLAAAQGWIWYVGAVALVLIGLPVYGMIQRIGFASRTRKRIAQDWGAPVKRARDMRALATLDPGASERFGPFRLDDATWNDLDLDAIYAQVDRTRTTPGAYVLSTFLRRPLLDPAGIERRLLCLAGVDDDAAGRKAVEVELRRLGREARPSLPGLLWDPLPERPPSAGGFTVLGNLPIAFGLLWALVSPFFVLPLILSLGLNMVLHYQFTSQVGSYGGGIPYLVAFVRTGSRLGAVKGAGSELAVHVERCGRLSRALRPIVRHGRMVASGHMSGGGGEFQVFSDYIRMAFLLEPRGYYGVLGDLVARREDARDLFLLIGEMDALISIASWRRSLDVWCAPTIDRGRQGLDLRDGRHPLLEAPVPNSITLRERNVLVTGSNMAGKSTFLRTVGLAALLGQALATCVAREYAAVPLRIATSIQHRDQVLAGRSFYLAEAERLLQILRWADEREPLLVLLDEPLRGTNSIERIAACHEILQYLDRQGVLTLVATHELQLARMLVPAWRAVHFTDAVTEEGLRFPYALEDGIATTRNAIQLLRELGFPETIPDAADRIAITLAEPTQPSPPA
jgi:hypothetical protein